MSENEKLLPRAFASIGAEERVRGTERLMDPIVSSGGTFCSIALTVSAVVWCDRRVVGH